MTSQGQESVRGFQAPAGFVRVPGLFRRAELEPTDKLEAGFHVVDAGTGPDGENLVAVFQREPQRRVLPSTPTEVIPISVEILLPEAPEHRRRLAVRYCDTCHRWGRRRSLHLCGVNWHHRLDHLMREIAAEGRGAFDNQVEAWP
jgi:hypothetical protein